MMGRTLFEGIFDRYIETVSKCKEKCVEEMMENAEMLKSGCDKFSIGYQDFGTEMCVCHVIEI